MNGVRFHFVGIGGIGMSSLARLCRDRGAGVSGCDWAERPPFWALQQAGCVCQVGHHPDHLQDIDIVVRSSAVPEDEPEIRAARQRGLPVLGRGEMLAYLLQDRATIAVGGSHGKTTTTWMTAHVLIEAGLDPSVMVGGQVPALAGNHRTGSGDYFVTEADESDGSFLRLKPTITVVTNVEWEHVDYYRDLEHLVRTFRRFLEQTRGPGCLVLCWDDPSLRALSRDVDRRRITYGFSEQADVRVTSVQRDRGWVFDLITPKGPMADVNLPIPGWHNLQNALAAIAVGMEVGIPLARLRRAVSSMTLVRRRLERKGIGRGVTVFDDYAHHPTEIRATLEALRSVVSGRLVAIFQPHRYTRTQQFCGAFARSYDQADAVFVLPIYSAAEPPIDGVSSERIVDEMRELGQANVRLASDRAELFDRVIAEVRPGDAVITLGAGDVTSLGPGLLAKLDAPCPVAETP